jgi:hypothetical protein
LIQSTGYQSGFGNEYATEAVAGALPIGRNSPQRVALGLYAEQISGTAFTAPRKENRRSWLYRMRPAAMHGTFARFDQPRFHNDFDNGPVTPDQLRWNPLPLPEAPVDFIDGLFTMAGNGSPAAQHGVGIHLYAANRDMQDRFFYDADGELLFVPQQGRLRIETELGVLDIAPQEIAIVPRGIRFRVALPDGASRGYVCENFGALMRLPDLGPIGSNGLANARDFLAPQRSLRRPRRQVRTDREIPGPSVARADRSFAARRRCLARQLRAGEVRPAPLQRDRFDQLRPSRSVDLHRADLAERYARHREPRLRRVPAALAGRAGHLPPAVVPPQRGQRIHGPGARRVRREGRRLRTRRRVAAQLHERARAGCGDVREGVRARLVEARRHPGHDGLHVRNARGDPPDGASDGRRAPPAQLPGLLGRFEEALLRALMSALSPR